MPVLEIQLLEDSLFGEETLGNFAVPIDELFASEKKKYDKYRLKGNNTNKFKS